MCENVPPCSETPDLAALGDKLAEAAAKVLLNQKKVRCPSCRVKRDGDCRADFPCPYRMMETALSAWREARK